MVPIHKKVLIGEQQKHLIAVFSREKGAYDYEVCSRVKQNYFLRKCTYIQLINHNVTQTNILVLQPETPQVCTLMIIVVP